MADKDETEEAVVTAEEQPGGAEQQQPLTVDDGIDDLKAKLAAAEARANAADARAASAMGHADQAQDEVTRSQLTVISGAIEQLTTAKDTLKAQYADAMAAGDFARAADINSTMADNAAKLFNLENGKIALETAPKREARRAAVASGDPVERAIGEWKLSAASAAWVRKHPEYATDPRKTQRMLAAHNLAVTDDLEPESDAYFAHVEKTLGLGYSDQRQPAPAARDVKVETPLSAAAAPAQRRDAAPPAAPSGRGSSNGRIRTLTPQQAEAAKISGVTNEEYAKQLERVAKERPN